MNQKQRDEATKKLVKYIEAKLGDGMWFTGFYKGGREVKDSFSDYSNTVSFIYDNSNQILSPIDIIKMQELVGAIDVDMDSGYDGDTEGSIGVETHIKFTFFF